MDEILRWVGFGIGILAVLMVLEALLGALFSRYGTPVHNERNQNLNGPPRKRQ